MKRRAFIAALGSAAAWPVVAGAQQLSKLATIGYLGDTSASDAQQWVGAFSQRLRELGWIDGRNLVIEYGWAEGSRDRAAQLTAEFVKLKVDVIVTYTTHMVLAAKQATSVIPIIFAGIADPVGTGVVASRGRQRYGLIAAADRYCQQASRIFARDSPKSPPVGKYGQH